MLDDLESNNDFFCFITYKIRFFLLIGGEIEERKSRNVTKCRNRCHEILIKPEIGLFHNYSSYPFL